MTLYIMFFIWLNLTKLAILDPIHQIDFSKPLDKTTEI